MATIKKDIKKDTVAVGIIRADEDTIYPNIDAQWGPWDSTAEYLSWVRGKNMQNDPSYIPPSGQKVGITQADGTIKELMWQQPDNGEGYWDDGTYDERSITGAVYFNTIAALKTATNLSAGDIAITKGYYSANDGGGSTFRIISSSSYAGTNWKQVISNESIPYLDDATLIQLQNGLYADILVPSSMEVNFLQMGARKMSKSGSTQISQPDNKPYMMKWLAFNDRRKTTYSLFISSGVYSFSETWLLRSSGNACALGVRIRGELMQNSGGSGSILIPHYTSQKYILRVGFKTNDIGYTGTDWIAMRGVVLRNLTFGTTRYAWQGNGITFQGLNIGDQWTLDPNDDATVSGNFYRYIVTRGALWIDSGPYGQYDGLYFSCVAGTCLYLTQCFESHFGYINVRGCGRFSTAGYVPPLITFAAPGPSDISACYFYYFNFEGNAGDFFYSSSGSFTHNEFNNIQIEGSLLNTTPVGNIGTIDKRSSVQKYDTDPDYTTPSVPSGTVFGKWKKWFVFTGNVGTAPNYINSISASNFGNGYKKYRTYALSNGNVVDEQGNVMTGGYVLENGVYYAVDGNGSKIVDFYRYYALFGEDENNSRDIQYVSNVPYFGSFVWNIGTVYLYRLPGMDEYCGPWVAYLRINAKTHHFVVNHIFDKNEYPYYFSGIKKVTVAKELCSIPGAIPFSEMINATDNSQRMTYTRKGCSAPNGICLKYQAVFSFIAVPGIRYKIRAYCTTSVYDTLLSHSASGGHPLLKWNRQLGIGNSTTAYMGDEQVIIPHSGWITIDMPDFGIDETTCIYFNCISGNTHHRNFLMGLYLDVLICG